MEIKSSGNLKTDSRNSIDQIVLPNWISTCKTAERLATKKMCIYMLKHAKYNKGHSLYMLDIIEKLGSWGKISACHREKVGKSCTFFSSKNEMFLAS